MLDIIKMLLAPAIRLLEKILNKDKLMSIKDKDLSEHYQQFSKNRKEEISFRQQTGISTNYLAIKKILDLYDDISIKTKYDIRVLKNIYDFINISEDKAFIEIKPIQKYLGLFLFWLSIIGICICFLSIYLVFWVETSKIKYFVTIVSFIFPFLYFMSVASPTIDAIRIKKILED